MSIHAFCSVSGAPGVTTASVAAAFHWPRPVILLEADTSHATSIMPGWFRGEMPHRDTGMLQITAIHRRGTITENDLFNQALELTQDRLVIPGFPSAETGENASAAWGAVMDACQGLEGAGVDVIFDLGRLGLQDHRNPIIGADSVVVFTAASMPGIYSVAKRSEGLKSMLKESSTEDKLTLALVSQAAPPSYDEREAKGVLGISVASTLPADAHSASIFSAGQPMNKKYQRSSYQRAISALNSSLITAVKKRRTRLGLNSPVISPLEGATS
ncbi:MAG: hypothetical protein L0G87_00450 [Renibacterium salmoninarum]|nr:hypothetical protein [Renibacterium salmoninarum]